MAHSRKGLNKVHLDQPRPTYRIPGQGPTQYGRTLQPHPYITAVLADNPIAFWQLNDDPRNGIAFDSSPYQQHLFISGTAGFSTDESGPYAGARGMVFPGTVTSYIQGAVKSPTATTFGTLSIEAWLKTTSTPDGNGRHWFHGRPFGSGSNTIACAMFTTDLRLTLNDTAGNITLPATFNDGGWHHVVQTFETTGNVYTAYFDGTKITTTTIATTTVPALNIVLGHDADSAAGGFAANQAWVGSMQGVAYYATELTANQVATHYNASLQPAGPQFRSL